MDIYDFQATIKGKDDFEKFLNMFYQDFLETGEEWENNSLENFLEALRVCCRASPEAPTWKEFADILLTAKVYE